MTPQQGIDALMAELFDARHKLALCRNIMEANDPGNALTIFGPPLTPHAEEGKQIEEAIFQAAGEMPERGEDVYA